MAKKLTMPAGVRDGRVPAKQAPVKGEKSPPATGISVRAPQDGETVNLRITKAEGGHIIEESRHDRNYRHETAATRVVTGDPTITVAADE